MQLQNGYLKQNKHSESVEQIKTKQRMKGEQGNMNKKPRLILYLMCVVYLTANQNLGCLHHHGTSLN